MGNAPGRLAVFFAMALTGACTMLANRDNGNHFITTYVLNGGTETTSPNTAHTEHILVADMPGAVPGFATPAMAYVTKPYRLDYYVDHRWADTPAHMLWPLLIQTLHDSGLFRAVVDPKAPVSGDLRLISKVLALQQVYQGDDSRVEFRFGVDVFDVAHQRLLAHRVFTANEPAEPTPYGGAVAANRAVTAVMKELVDYLSRQAFTTPLQTQGGKNAGVP